MPVVHTSTIKRARQSVKRRQRNRAVMSTTKAAVKKVRNALDKKETEQIQTLLREASSQLHQAVSKGSLKKNTASRQISRLTLQVNKLKTSQSRHSSS